MGNYRAGLLLLPLMLLMSVTGQGGVRQLEPAGGVQQRQEQHHRTPLQPGEEGDE